MIRVIQCIDGLQRGGKERRLVELVKALRGVEDIETSLIVLSRRVQYEEVSDLGIDVHLLERRFRKDPTIVPRLASLCHALRPQVLHAWGSFASVCAVPAAKWARARLVTSMITHAPERSRLSRQRRFRAALVFPFADAVLANSRAGLASYRAPPHKSLCIYNGFDFARIEGLEPAAAVRERLGVSTRWLVGMVASFTPHKDYGSYLAAAQAVLADGFDATFLAVGDGPTLEASRARVAPRWRDRIVFPGSVARIEPLVNALDVGVLCTDERLHGEGISNAILEYMALGKPVIATTGGGTGELVRDGGTGELPQDGATGFLVPPRDPNALADRLRALLRDDGPGTSMGLAGERRVRAHFTVEQMVLRHVEIYRCLATRAAASP